MGSIKHTFVSAIADGANANLVKPSNWNADHTFNLTVADIIGAAPLASPTFTGKVITGASAAVAGAGFNLPHGVAPNAPADGDIWTTLAGGIYVRINGATVGPLSSGGGDTGIFALLAGRAGGQTLYGGTGASENIILDSTFHATKGFIQYGLDAADNSAVTKLIKAAGSTTDVAGATLALQGGKGSGTTYGPVVIPNGNLSVPLGQLLVDGARIYVNTAFMYNSMYFGVTAGNLAEASTTGANIGIGKNTLKAVTSGYQNVCIGENSGTAITTGYDNVGLGFDTLQFLDAGPGNFALGSLAMQRGTAVGCQNNIAIGYAAMRLPLTPYGNVAIGSEAMHGVLTNSPNYNIAIGSRALYVITTGERNVAVGYWTMNAVTTGSKNVTLGMFTGMALTTQAGNIFIGNEAGRYETGSNTLLVDNQDRTNEATGRTNALLYGIMAAAPANQSLVVNGAYVNLSVGVLKVAGTQVVGARVVDARCDDVINSGDATTDGVIDSLRDAMIAHGLIAAA